MPKAQLGGVVGLSGALCAKLDQSKIDFDLKYKTKILLYHGEADPTIPCDAAKFSYNVLKDKGLDYSLTTEPGLEHNVSMDMIMKVTNFFKETMVTPKKKPKAKVAKSKPKDTKAVKEKPKDSKVI